MNRPSLFHWFARWAIGWVVGLTLLFAVLVVVNIVDYVPYGFAVRRVRNLTAGELKSLASATTQYEKAGHQRLIGDAIPKEFRSLRPIGIDLFPGSTDVTLLERGGGATIEDLRWNRYVFLRMSTGANNQTIELVTYAGDHQRSQTLWEKNPDATKRLSPSGRVVTISTNDMHSSTDWIVLPNKLLVINRSYTVGRPSEISPRFRLSPIAARRSMQQFNRSGQMFTATPLTRAQAMASAYGSHFQTTGRPVSTTISYSQIHGGVRSGRLCAPSPPSLGTSMQSPSPIPSTRWTH